MKKIYGKLKMSWTAVIIFAVITGIYSGIVMLIPALDGTSFQDIGISYEWWVIFAVIIVVNCKKGTEAMLKCFVFFLISQPLVYITEIVFGDLSIDLAKTYYLRIWLPMTVLTLPGGFIAYQCKRQNVFGAVVLALGNTIQAILGCSYFFTVIKHPPYHILTSAVCFASIFVMGFYIQHARRRRLIAVILPFILTACVIIFALYTGRTISV